MITELATTWSQFMNDVSGGNAFLAGTLSLWFLSVLTYLGRNIPMKVFTLAKLYSTTIMTLNNGGYTQEQTMYNFIAWLSPRMNSKLSRTLSVESDTRYNGDGSVDVTIGVGFGLHFFFFNKRLFWIRKTRLESSGSNLEKFEIVLGTIGRSHKPFQYILSSFAPKKDKNKNSIYHITDNGHWERFTEIPKRPLESVAMDSKLKSSLIDQINHFKGNRQWFYDRALAYKLTYILHGMPGTGKTSIIKSIASEFDMNLCIININYMSDRLLEVAFSSIPDNSIVIMEDFDSSSITKSRGITYKEKMGESEDTKNIQAPKSTGNKDDSDANFSFLSLTGFLNALDGIIPMDNCIVFMTTNDIDKVDPAIYRKGRVDHMIEVGYLTEVEILEYCEYLFPDYDFSEYSFRSTIGCKLHDALLSSKDSVELFVEHLIDNDIMSKN